MHYIQVLGQTGEIADLRQKQSRLLSNLETALKGYKPLFVGDFLYNRATRLITVLRDPRIIEKTLFERKRAEVRTTIRETRLLEEARTNLLQKIANKYLKGRKKRIEEALEDGVIVTELKKQNQLARTVRTLLLAKALTLDEVVEDEVDDLCDRLEQAKVKQQENFLVRLFSRWKPESPTTLPDYVGGSQPEELDNAA